MEALLLLMDGGWPTVDGVVFAVGVAALLAHLINSASSSTPRLGTTPPGAFIGAGDAATAAARTAGSRTMLGLGPPPTARELVAGLASGSLTAEGVISSMLERASVAHEMTNCIVPCKPSTAAAAARTAVDGLQAIVPETVRAAAARTVSGSRGNPLRANALAAAKTLDKTPKAQRGPLHGLPFSVKECMSLAGTDATAGLGKLHGTTFLDISILQYPFISAFVTLK